MIKSILLFLAILFISPISQEAHSLNEDHSLCGGFLPHIDLASIDYTKFSNKTQSGITKEQYDRVASRFHKEFAPDIEANGVKFSVSTQWSSNAVVAGAGKEPRRWYIDVRGGFARLPGVTEIGFAGVLCHEVGHLIGGAPRKTRFGKKKITNEGQADYFATSKCMRRIFSAEENTEFAKTLEIDPFAKVACDQTFPDDKNEQIYCYRSAIAAIHLAYLIRNISTPDSREDYYYDTPDTNVVDKTFQFHPKAQCRMDTFFQGALCNIDALDNFDAKDPKVGACNRSDDYINGARPLCWYKP